MPTIFGFEFSVLLFFYGVNQLIHAFETVNRFVFLFAYFNEKGAPATKPKEAASKYIYACYNTCSERIIGIPTTATI